MPALPLQLGFLIEFPPLLGPVLIGLGLTVLTLWSVQTHLVPSLAGGRLVDSQQRARIVAPLVLGILLVALGTAVRTNVVWVVVIVLFALGRAIEGGITIRTIRRIAYYLTRVVGIVNPRTTRAEGEATGLGGYLWSRIVYQIITILVVTASVTLTTFGVLAIRPTADYALSVVWATVVSTMSVFVFVWDLRATLDHMDAVPVVGILFCILGAEVYNFSARVLPPAVSHAVRRVLPEAGVGVLLVQQGVFQYVLYLIGWVAYCYGIAVATSALVTK